MVKITDKSEGVRYLPWTFLLPHYLIILINALAIITSPISSLVFGYYWFSFVIVFTYSISILISLVLNFGENLNKLDNIQKLKYAINHLPTIGISINSIGLMFYSLSYLIYNFV
ncbi:MAG: hypothetical protein HC932_04300 [Thermales bacterium]|nr:hypothetical protein [Thermales bacterium]